MQLADKSFGINRGRPMRMPWCLKSYMLPILLMVLSGCGVGPTEESLTLPSGSTGGTTSSSNALAAPTVNVAARNGSTILEWNEVGANQYRVLYWQGSDAPQEHTTNSIAYTLPNLSSGNYTVIVEAYDALGNSLFSTPVTVVIS